MADYASFYDAIYEREGTDAVITLDDTAGTEIEVRALYMPSGMMIGGQPVQMGTVRMSAAIRRTELTDAGLTDLADLDRATIEFTEIGETWRIKSWVPAPAPIGEAQGELRLILAEAS